jgi:hypothetical protein
MTMSGYLDHAKVSQIRYTHPELSAEDPIKFYPKGLWTPKIDADNIAYLSLFQPFNLNQYLYPRPPIDMGLIEVEPLLACPINVLRMPLKYPKSSTWMTDGNEYRIPRQLGALMPFIQRVAEYEKSLYPQDQTSWNDEHNFTFCHITFDHSVVPAGQHHRYPGFHGDGIQGTKLTPKINAEHSYILTSAPATQFCLQPFFLKHLDEAKHNFFLEFDRQAKEANFYSALPNHLYLIDPYMVHRTPKLEKETDRVFIRITYTSSELEHPKNTTNPLFDKRDYPKRIDIRENLAANEFEVPWHLYGLSR